MIKVDVCSETFAMIKLTKAEMEFLYSRTMGSQKNFSYDEVIDEALSAYRAYRTAMEN